jgi:hypothetical protein
MVGRSSLSLLVFGSLALAMGCGSSTSSGLARTGSGSSGGDGSSDSDGGLAIGTDPSLDDGGTDPVGGVASCAQAAAAKAYVGCDFWPTPVANAVWSTFDFAAVVANASPTTVSVTVTGPNNFSQTVSVAAHALQPIYLPWVQSLKGGDADECGAPPSITSSVLARKGAYHLVTTAPVTVYQFNALEYKGEGGPAGKNWSSCPGNRSCPDNFGPVGCFSFSNDASLLLPSSAMTGNYRVVGSNSASFSSSYVAITATQDNTTVQIKIGAHGNVLSGGSIAALQAGGTGNYTLNAGDVVELFTSMTESADLSGSVITASAPVQVVSGVPCITVPSGSPACDHVEESVFPAETLGKDYVVTVPTGPTDRPVGHVVRLVGNVDGTNLQWTGTRPAGAPSTINAGQVVDLGRVNKDFRVTGDNAFGIATLMLGGSIVDPTAADQSKGDPSMSFPASVEQYRDSYIFLAPTDYDVNVVDVVYPPAAEGTLKLDGVLVTSTGVDIPNSGHKVMRLRLANTNGGAHELTAGAKVGIQVSGYGSYTSYQYPGGLNLKLIAPPPIR